MAARKKADGYGRGRHVGEPGERRGFELTPEGDPRRFEKEWGEGFVYRFRDDANNLLVWMTGKRLEGIVPGRRCLVRATVKRHGEWGGVRETHLARVKLVGERREPDRTPDWFEAPGGVSLLGRRCGCGHAASRHERVVTRSMATFEACRGCGCVLFRPKRL